MVNVNKILVEKGNFIDEDVGGKTVIK